MADEEDSDREEEDFEEEFLGDPSDIPDGAVAGAVFSLDAPPHPASVQEIPKDPVKKRNGVSSNKSGDLGPGQDVKALAEAILARIMPQTVQAFSEEDSATVTILSSSEASVSGDVDAEAAADEIIESANRLWRKSRGICSAVQIRGNELPERRFPEAI
jgi:hypothetical protein